MRSVVVLPGRPPLWLQHHARHLAVELSGRGRVMIIALPTEHLDRLLPAEMGTNSVLGGSPTGYPMWKGGLTAAIGVRRTRDHAVVVLWPGCSTVLALLCVLTSRLRRERVVLEIQRPDEGTHRTRRAGWAIIGKLAHTVVESRPVAPMRKVVAIAGSDAAFAYNVARAFNGMSVAAVEGWELRLITDRHLAGQLRNQLRHDLYSVVEVGVPHEASLEGAAAVMVPYGCAWQELATRAASTGSSGVVVGHPVACRVASSGDGVWYAAADPSSILVAMESATGAAVDEAVDIEACRDAGSRVLESVGA